MALFKIIKLFIFSYCIALYFGCTTQNPKTSYKSVNQEIYSVDSFTIESPLYVINEQSIIDNLDSLIANAKVEQKQDFWDSKFPPFITIEPFSKMDSTFYKFKIGKDYLLNFDPPEIKFSKKVFYGFGVARYKGLLVQLNGTLPNYSLVTDTGIKKVVSDVSKNISFNAYGIKNTERNNWVEYFFPFLRSYFYVENGNFIHHYSEVEK